MELPETMGNCISWLQIYTYIISNHHVWVLQSYSVSFESGEKGGGENVHMVTQTFLRHMDIEWRCTVCQSYENQSHRLKLERNLPIRFPIQYQSSINRFNYTIPFFLSMKNTSYSIVLDIYEMNRCFHRRFSWHIARESMLLLPSMYCKRDHIIYQWQNVWFILLESQNEFMIKTVRHLNSIWREEGKWCFMAINWQIEKEIDIFAPDIDDI